MEIKYMDLKSPLLSHACVWLMRTTSATLRMSGTLVLPKQLDLVVDSQLRRLTLQPDASMGGLCAATDDSVQQESN